MESKSEPLTVSTEASKRKSIIMIIAIVLVVILLVSTIVVSIQLSSKSSDYDDLKSEKEKSDTNYNNLNTKYQQLEKKYENQNDTLNNIFNTFQGLIANTTMPSTSIKKGDYIKVKDRVNATKNFEDGTYDYLTLEKKSYPKGYHVSFETKTRYYEYYYTDEEYDNIVYKIASLLGVNADLGVFNHLPQISFYIEDKKLALSVAALFNQQSIWDWSKNEIIVNPLHQPKYY